jgi:hypothetical protein
MPRADAADHQRFHGRLRDLAGSRPVDREVRAGATPRISLGCGKAKSPGMHELIGDITLCILFTRVLGLLAHFSWQPLIPAYLIAGFFIGPFGMGWVKSQESIGITPNSARSSCCS